MITSSSRFSTIAKTLISDAETAVALGERTPTILRDYRQRYRYCEPQLSELRVRDIDHRTLKSFQRALAERGLKATSVATIMSFVSRGLELAAAEGAIRTVPKIPRPSHTDAPRPAFTRSEYRTLLLTLRRIERGNPQVAWKSTLVDRELRDIVTFVVNSFFRPGDVFTLKHKHVEVIDRSEGETYLRLNPPASKGHANPIVSMPVAVPIYRRLLARQTARGYGEPEDYVFLPDRANRAYAKEIVRRLFQKVLKEAGLKETVHGVPHTLYSLRHTAIVFRLLNAEGLDLLTLARNCRTSVEMIDRFYASSLTAEMNFEKLHSFRRPTRFSAAALSPRAA